MGRATRFGKVSTNQVWTQKYPGIQVRGKIRYRTRIRVSHERELASRAGLPAYWGYPNG